MKVSVLLPTRKRVAACLESVRSLYATAGEHELEVLVRVDDDDVESYQALRHELPTEVHISIGVRHGYHGAHHYVNELAKLSTGDWLLVWNDDAEMCSSGWIDDMESYGDQLVVLFESDKICFPAIPRKLYEILGCFAEHSCTDTYLSEVAVALGILRHGPRFVVNHRLLSTEADDREREADPYIGIPLNDTIAHGIATISSFLLLHHEDRF